MVHAEWRDVANLVLALVGREPPFLVILFWLGVAFSVLMFVEGVRWNFFPWRAVTPRAAGARPLLLASTFSSNSRHAALDVRAVKPTLGPIVRKDTPPARRQFAPNPKRPAMSVKRQIAVRPHIRRVPQTAEEPQFDTASVSPAFASEPALAASAPVMSHVPPVLLVCRTDVSAPLSKIARATE